eukprot:COSAG05_NODE_4865_length_1343_cov_1.540193_2_plen_74_part_00
MPLVPFPYTDTTKAFGAFVVVVGSVCVRINVVYPTDLHVPAWAVCFICVSHAFACVAQAAGKVVSPQLPLART